MNKSTYSKIIIEAFPSKEGTLTMQDGNKYIKSFNVQVSNAEDEPVYLHGLLGSYRAFDNKGGEFEIWAVDAQLYGTLDFKGSSKSGEMFFMSDNESVYDANFIKWILHSKHSA